MGSTAVAAFDPNVLRQLSRRPLPAQTEPLFDLARKAERITSVVETRWDDLAQKERELLRSFAYELIRPRRASVFARILDRIVGAFLVLTGERHALAFAVVSLYRLADAILNAVEREQVTYTETAAAACEEAVSGARVRIEPGGFREWLSSVSSRTHS